MPEVTPAQVAIIVATHGDLAEALLRTAKLITGPMPGVICLGLAAGEAQASFEMRLTTAIPAAVSSLVLVDLFGGTPWNVALRLTRSRPQMRVVSGVNLPMLLEVMLAGGGDQDADADQLARLARQAGVEAVRTSV